MIETTMKSHLFFFWYCIYEEKAVRFFCRLSVHMLELFDLDGSAERVVDLSELSLVTRLVHGELCRVEAYHTGNTDPGLCQQGNSDRNVPVFDHHVIQQIAPTVRVQSRALSVVHDEKMRRFHDG